MSYRATFRNPLSAGCEDVRFTLIGVGLGPNETTAMPDACGTTSIITTERISLNVHCQTSKWLSERRENEERRESGYSPGPI